MALPEFIVSFREVFEIALVLGIILSYLYRTKNAVHAGAVYAGAAAAVAASAAAAFLFESMAGGFAANDALFEGATMAASAILVTWLNFWMFGQRNVKKSIEGGAAARLGKGAQAGLAAFAFFAVFREGVEIAIFLAGIFASQGALDTAAAALGGAAGAVFAYAALRGALKIDMKLFFSITFALLVLLAAGLLSQGVHELQEAKVIPTTIEHIYDITPAQNADGSYPLLHEKGLAGGVLKSLFGYSTSPSLEQAGAYLAYLGAVYVFYRRVSRR